MILCAMLGQEITLFAVLMFHARCLGQFTDGESRLFRGQDNTTGIVQIYSSDEWKTLCGLNFQDKEAGVICRHHGFIDGRSLPLGAYGEYPGLVDYPEVLQGCETGQELRLVDCTFDVSVECNLTSYAYASVKCFDDLEEPPASIRLDNGNSVEAGYFSSLSVYRYGTWGQVCWEFWDDQDALVACRELGYAGGKSSFFDRGQSIPFLVGNIQCHGNESSLENCYESKAVCGKDRVAGVFCYKTEEPKFSLVGGTAEYFGKVILSVDGMEGVICKNGLTYETAEVICREMGYHKGYDMQESYPAPTVTTVFLQDVDCAGNERSFWECPNNGWGSLSASCQDPDNGFNIYCYSKVRIFSRDIETKDLFIGRVELLEETWHAICAEAFTQTYADLVCSEFGYVVAEILVPDAFGRRRSSSHVNSISCAGTEDSLSECNYTIGACENYDGQAYLLCRQENVTSDVTVTLSTNSYYGRVYWEYFGKRGTICRRGWDDNDAVVTCKMFGYNYGQALGPSEFVERYMPVWVTDVSCNGDETDLRQCEFSLVNGTDLDCAQDLVAAGVLCSNNQPPDPPVRLADGTAKDRGRVEVYHEQKGWGTICNTDWSVNDADVFCKELGYAEGQLHVNTYTGTAQGPVVLNAMDCKGTETSLLQCPSNGWDRVSSICDHSRDAGAFCYRHVILTPSAFYGAVLVHKGGYKLVCADGFDETAAHVVCKELGFFHSVNLCCSAFGPQRYDIGVSDVQCTGNEDSLRHCDHEEVNISCPSGNYAAMVCSTYNETYQGLEVLGDGKIRVNYFINDGFICAEDFTDSDAQVVCREDGFSYGYGIKASAKGNEHNIRWLRDIQCIGNETAITDCDNIHWGQIGVCDWDMVAGVICTQDQVGLEFDFRLVNGTETSGRVEVKINNEWGTVCGIDFTKKEAVVICAQLGYFDGAALTAGYHGEGSGEVILSGMTCSGREKTLKDCVWEGYKQTSGLCDHSKDAAVRCYYNLRLAGSTTENYGRLEVYNNDDADWLAVCDYGLNINEANVICRMLGYNTGLFQKSSPLGPTDQPITVSEVTCGSQYACTFKMGDCRSGKYVALYCSKTVITTENVKVRLPLSSFYGPVEINRFGLWGAICDLDFDDKDAAVVCRQLNFKSGYAVRTFATDGFPIIQGDVNCAGDEVSLGECDRGAFADGLGCYDRNTVAGVICYDDDGLNLTKTDVDHSTGVMETRIEIETVGNKLYIALDGFTDVDASVYCKGAGFGGGKVFRTGSGSYGVTQVSCHGDETSIWQCRAVWDPQKTEAGEGALAGVSCVLAVSLLGGNLFNHGILYSTQGFDNGPVCAEGFDETDAGVACRNLDFESGLVLCCSPYGTSDDQPSMTNVQCNGDEDNFLSCSHSNVSASDVSACQVNYAAVACYNGEKTSDYSVSLPEDKTYSGVLILTYLEINGRICSDGWDNKDASVVCSELGFFKGIAQIHQREDIRESIANGPYWTSDVNCTGTEEKLGDCGKIELGAVTKCESRHYAGVVCYDKDGLAYRLAGSDEARYGRVEVSVKEEWRSICDLYWGNNEAHVLCTMIGYRTGEAYHGTYKDTGQGPVWDANFECAGSELALNDCPFTSWEIATSPECAVHQNDAGAFCYTSVKLSTGVGRMTDRGGVLLYWNDKWNTICSDDFNDTSARVVCRELGFEDGRAQCCSAYGDLLQYGHVVTHKVKCQGDETDVTSCLVEDVCGTQEYASVICYGFLLTTETVTVPAAEKKFDATPIIIAVVLFVALVIIALIVLYIVRKRRQKLKLDKSKEKFGDRIVSETGDRSIIVENPMRELGTPNVPRVHYTNSGGYESADISPAYLNPSYSGVVAEASGSREPADISGIQPVINQEPVQTGSYQTVINVNPHQYEKLNLNPNKENPDTDNLNSKEMIASQISNPYDSIKTKQMDNSSVRDDSFRSTMVEQPHVSSPQAIVEEPKWPDTEQ